jgi:hypothetical protein
MPLASLTWRTPALLSAVGCLAMGAGAALADMHKPIAPAVEQRRLFIRSGTLFTKDGVPINLSRFDSEIESEKTSQDLSPEAKQIKDVVVHSGNAFVRAQDLGKLLQTRIKNDKLTDLAVETVGSEIQISGHLKKTIPVHFAIKGPVTLTDTGLIDLHENSMKIDKLPMKGLAEMLGMDPGHVVGENSGKGLQANKDDILMDPNALWGMSVHGKLTQVKVVNNGLMLIYGAARKPPQTSKSTAPVRGS